MGDKIAWLQNKVGARFLQKMYVLVELYEQNNETEGKTWCFPFFVLWWIKFEEWPLTNSYFGEKKIKLIHIGNSLCAHQDSLQIFQGIIVVLSKYLFHCST